MALVVALTARTGTRRDTLPIVAFSIAARVSAARASSRIVASRISFDATEVPNATPTPPPDPPATESETAPAVESIAGSLMAVTVRLPSTRTVVTLRMTASTVGAMTLLATDPAPPRENPPPEPPATFAVRPTASASILALELASTRRSPVVLTTESSITARVAVPISLKAKAPASAPAKPALPAATAAPPDPASPSISDLSEAQTSTLGSGPPLVEQLLAGSGAEPA